MTHLLRKLPASALLMLAAVVGLSACAASADLAETAIAAEVGAEVDVDETGDSADTDASTIAQFAAPIEAEEAAADEAAATKQAKDAESSARPIPSVAPAENAADTDVGEQAVTAQPDAADESTVTQPVAPPAAPQDDEPASPVAPAPPVDQNGADENAAPPTQPDEVVPPGDDDNDHNDNNDDVQEEPPPPPPPVEPTITNINFVEDTFVPLVEPTFVRFDAALLPGPGTFTVTVGCPWDNTSSTFSFDRFENGQFIAAGDSCASPGQSHVYTFESQPGITYEYRFDVVDQANSADRGRLRVQWAADPVEPAGPPPAPNEGDGPNNPRPFAIGRFINDTLSGDGDTVDAYLVSADDPKIKEGRTSFPLTIECEGANGEVVVFDIIVNGTSVDQFKCATESIQFGTARPDLSEYLGNDIVIVAKLVTEGHVEILIES